MIDWKDWLTPKEFVAAAIGPSGSMSRIENHRLGGWYAHRAFKTALSMLLKTSAIELSRRAPAAICISPHPGLAATRLPEPFRRNVAWYKLFTETESAAPLLRLVANVAVSDSGEVLAWDGSRIPA